MGLYGSRCDTKVRHHAYPSLSLTLAPQRLLFPLASVWTDSARLAEARQIVEAWRQDYNHVRPHSSLNYLTPMEFVAAKKSAGVNPCIIKIDGRQNPVYNLARLYSRSG